MIKNYIFWLAMAGAFIAGAGGAAWVQEVRYEGIIAEKERKLASERVEQLEAAAIKVAAAQTALTAAEIEYLGTLRAKDEEINRLSNPAKPARVFVGADCPASSPGVPETAGGTTGRTAELNAESRQLYFRHRALIAKYEATVKLCRDYALTVQRF